MAIEIIDGFKVSSAVPVDNRIVASGSTARDAITYKYEGLRVFDTSDSIPYVWVNNSWNKENKSALNVAPAVTPGYGSSPTSNGSSTLGQILKVYNQYNLLTNSNMFEVEFKDSLGNLTGKTIAINHGDSYNVSSSSKLDVHGNIKASSFEGSGANIKEIDPANFNTSTNKIQTNQISPGASGFILQTVDDGSGILSPQWKNPTSIISPESVKTTIETGSSIINYLTFVPATSGGNLLVYKNTPTQAIGVIPFTGQVVVKSDNSPTIPPYSFVGETNTGIYRSAAGSLAISILGNKKIEIDTNGLKVNAGNAANPGISFIGANNYGFYQTTTGNNRIGIIVNSAEVIRIKSTGGQGNGNMSIYGDGNILTLQGRGTSGAGTYIEFYRSGSSTPDSPSTLGSRIGYLSGSSSNLTLQNDGIVSVQAKNIGNYGLVFVNNADDYGHGVSIIGKFTTSNLSVPAGCYMAQFVSREASGDKTSIFITKQGIELAGVVPGGGSGAGNATYPSLYFNGDADTGIYSSGNGNLSITSNGTTRMTIDNNKVTLLNLPLSFGVGSSDIRKIIMGNVIIKPRGAAPTIVRGSGFTITHASYNDYTEAVLVTFTTPMPSTPFIVASRSQEYSDGTPNIPDSNAYAYQVSVFNVNTLGFNISVTNITGVWPPNGYFIRVGFICICS